MLNLLKQRRIIASLLWTVSVLLSIAWYNDFDSEVLVDAILSIINWISIVSAIVLPIISYFKPKK